VPFYARVVCFRHRCALKQLDKNIADTESESNKVHDVYADFMLLLLDELGVEYEERVFDKPIACEVEDCCSISSCKQFRREALLLVETYKIYKPMLETAFGRG
jgi:hypothetical protein